MKRLIAILSVFSGVAFAASVTITDPTCTSYAISQVGGDIALTCSGAAPVPVPVPTPIPTPEPIPTPTNDLICDASMTRSQANARMYPILPGHAAAFSFVASGYSHPAIQYNNVSAAVSISTTPCDFAPAQWQCLGVSTVGPGVFASTSDPRYCLLTEGQTYYMNVRMATRVDGKLIEACIDGSVGSFTGSQCEFMPF